MVPDSDVRSTTWLAWPIWLRAGLFSLAYFLCAEASTYLSAHGGSMVSFWIPAGLYVSVLLLNPGRDWPWLSLGAFVGNLVFDHFYGTPFFPTVGFYCANSVEAWSGAWLIRRWVAPRPTLATLKEIIGLMLASGLFSTMLGATIGAATLVHSGFSNSFLNSWKIWWGSNTLAILLFAPFFLIWFSRPPVRLNYVTSPKKKLELVALMLVLTSFIVYLLVWDKGVRSESRALLVPFLLWAGLRFGPRIGAAISIGVALPLAFFTTQHFVGLTPEQIATGDYVFGMQMLLAMANLVALVPAVVLDERRRAEQALRESEEKFSKAFYSSPDAISISDLATGKFIEVNEGFPKIYGYTREEIIGHTSVELQMWGSEADRVKLLQRLAADRVLRNYDGLGRKRSGELFPNLFSAEIVTLKGRECLICVVHDLTVQKRAEALVTAQMQVLEMIAAGKPMKETLEALLKFMQVQSPDLLCSILLLDQESKRLHHGAATALPEEFIRAVDGVAIGPSVGSCGTAAFRREPVFVADIAHDPLWSMTKELALPHGLLACWSTPIFDARQQVLGTFAIYRRTVGLPDEAQLQMIEMATHTAAVCIGRHRSETERAEALIREQQARVQYTFQLIASQEAERKRIAAELHDSMGQNLLLIKNLAQMAARSQEPALVYEQVATISQLATQCIAEARQISRELHPHQLDHLGLQRALEVMLETAASASSVIFSWKIEDTGDVFSAEAKMNLYRIVQESLSNSLKHSNAQHIRVRLERDVHEVVLEFADDGCGFDPAVQTSSKSGMGLKNITERARMLGGRLKLDAAPGRGARLEISIPVADTIE